MTLYLPPLLLQLLTTLLQPLQRLLGTFNRLLVTGYFSTGLVKFLLYRCQRNVRLPQLLAQLFEPLLLAGMTRST